MMVRFDEKPSTTSGILCTDGSDVTGLMGQFMLKRTGVTDKHLAGRIT